MSLTEKEFTDKISIERSAKWLNQEVNPMSGHNTIFALDTYAETQLPYQGKFNIAQYVWENDTVVKDGDGLFNAGTPAVFGVPPMGGIPYWYTPQTVPVNVTISLSTDSQKPEMLKFIKCVCGANSVGSNRHSSWCDIKGD